MNGKGAGYVFGQTVLMLAALLAPFLDDPTTPWPLPVTVAGAICIATGITLAIAASLTLGQRSLSPFPKPKPGAALVQQGVFSAMRHPIYTGLTLLVLGWALAWSSLPAAIGALILLAFFDVKARREERWLEAEFPEYPTYKRRVKKLIPLIY